MSFITVQNINFEYNNKQILQDVSFDIIKNDIVTIIGPNGCGKSTLAKLMIGALNPTSGSIRYDKSIKIGYMPQKINFSKMIPMTVKDFLKLFITDFKLSCKKTLEFLKVDKLLNLQIFELSGGQLQRVLLAAALIDKPNFLILDEPLQAIDHSGQIEFYSLIEHLRSTHNITILLISHDLHTVMSKTDKVICLNGHICCYGKPKEISDNPEFISLFKSDKVTNFAIYEHNHDHKHN